MELSIWLARVIGVVYFVVALGILFNGKYYQKVYQDYFKDTSVVILGGLSALAIGMAMVLAHNYWVASWEVILTLFGWAALLKGILFLLLPEQMKSLVKSMFKGMGIMWFAGIGALALGVVLGYFGFFA